MNRIAIALGFLCLSPLVTIEQVKAQTVVPDSSLGTIVTPNNGNFTITGGSLAGSHLFHSFREFSIPTGGSASFDLVNTPNVSTIFSRVTGSTASSIDGLIKTINHSTPVSLFLLNPNGVLFGKNARLDLSGSFVATTANQIHFADSSEFAANPTAPPLLTMSAPIGLQFGSNPGQIINRSTVNNVGLQVPTGKSIVLAGGEIRLEGGRLRSTSGQLELASVAAPGTISITPDLRLTLPSDLTRGDISLSEAALANVNGTPGGRIAIHAANLNLTGGSLVMSQISGVGAPDSRSGNIEINASDTINITDASGMINRVLANSVGNAGNLDIQTGSLFVTNGSFLVTSTRGRGNAGQMNIQATKTVAFDGVDRFGNPSLAWAGVNGGATGNGGTITIRAESLSVMNGAYIASSTLSRGNAGTINLQAKTATFSGQDADGNSTFVSSAVAAAGAIGMAGDLNITADALFVANGAFLSTATLGKGNGGTMNITANTASFDGYGRSGAATFATSAVNENAIGNGGVININANALSVTNGALLTTITVKPGSAGDINVNANTLDVLNGGQILSTSFGSGKAGTLTFNVRDRITLSGSDPNYTERSKLPGFNDAFSIGAASGLFGNTVEGQTGAGGDLRIQTRELFVQEGARASVSNLGAGNAGNLIVTADSIRLSNAASLSAESRAGSQGNISLSANDIVLRQGSTITTNATGTATGGNITIAAPIILGLENSDISANAVQGQGGKIEITTEALLGLKYRDRLTPESDITASSEFGVSGSVQINTIGVDPNSGLIELPVDLSDASQQIAKGCKTNQGNRFVVTGRGGVPMNPSEQVRGDRTWNDLRHPMNTGTIATAPLFAPLVEATAWERNSETGKVQLIAAQPMRSQSDVTCAVSSELHSAPIAP
ncbi:unknown protein [Leptolyngbya sp. NIES-3755]|nr:unknown protein [Leptolyngbya sp. NIES-3755]